MALQLGALNQALRQAGVDDALARQAAEEAANYDNRLIGIERQMDQRFNEVDQRFNAVDHRFNEVDRRIDALGARMDQRFAEVEQRFTAIDGRLNLLSWMLGSFGTVLLGLLAAVLAKLLVS